jgi:hypothetical protein
MVTYHRGNPRSGIETQIADALERLCDEADPVEYVSFAGGAAYVQFTVTGPTLYGEAAENSYLPPAAQLSATQATQVTELGWNPPKETPGNFWQTWANADLGELATLVVATLEVHGVPARDIAIALP